MAYIPSATSTTYHPEHLLDRATMLAMRTMIALQPAPDLGPGGRPAFDKLVSGTPAADGVTYETGTVGGVPGWWCHPPDADRDVAILYLHGGAYIMGSAQAYCQFAGQIAVRANVPAFVADYRLAPEHPFPAATDDADAAYRGLATVGFSRIAIVGDSAGGGLALVTASRMARAGRDGSVPRPAAVVAISPWADLALSGDSIVARATHDPLLTRSALDNAAQLYLGRHDAKDPRVSPLYGDLTSLPPVLLHVGEDEILLDDARRYSDLSTKSGSSAELHVWQGMVHVFPANLALLHAAREALDNTGGFLRRHLAADAHRPSLNHNLNGESLRPASCSSARNPKPSTSRIPLIRPDAAYDLLRVPTPQGDEARSGESREVASIRVIANCSIEHSPFAKFSATEF